MASQLFPQASPDEVLQRVDGHKRLPSRDRGILSGIVAAAFDVPAKDLRAPTRGRAKVALARQIATYLAHVVLGMTLSDAGRLYGRDRTTAAHACRLVEDLRDEPRFDTLLSLLEEMVHAEIVRRAVRSAAR